MNQNINEPYAQDFVVYPNYTDFNNFPTKKVKRITRTIEKWGPEGEYLGKEIIVEDLEDVEVPDYSFQPYQPNIYDFPFPTICDATGSITISGNGTNFSLTTNPESWNINPNAITYTSKN